VITGDDRTQEWYGGGAYPLAAGWQAAWLAALVFPTSSSGQTYNEIEAGQDPTIQAGRGAGFSGPFLVLNNLQVHPVGTYVDQFRFNGGGQGGMFIAWNDFDSYTGFKTPAASAGDTAAQSGLPFEPGLLLGHSLSDEVSGTQVTGGPGAAGFYVVTPSFQGCALVDGSGSPGAFQSFLRGFLVHVDATDVHAGTVALTQDGFVMTTIDDAISAQSTTWQAFGHPMKRGWIPQIVRYL
jgi:hypothetical protein